MTWKKLRRLFRFLLPEVKSIMSSPIDTIRDDAQVSEALELMTIRRVGSLVVTVKGKPIGMFTRSDLFNRVLNRGISSTETKIRDVMSSPIITVSPNMKVYDVVRVMREKDVSHVVVQERVKMIGILTKTDIEVRLPRHLRSYKSVFKRYLVDTFTYIIFWSGLVTIIQVLIIGIPIEKFIVSSLLGFLVTLLLGGIYGRVIDILRDKFKA